MKLSNLKAGDSVFADSGFTCLHGGFHTVEQDDKGLFIKCDDGHHYLDGQADECGNLVGLLHGLDPRTTIELMGDQESAVAEWTLEDNTNGKSGGYLQIKQDGKRVVDAFPYAKDADEKWVRGQAQLIVDTMNIACGAPSVDSGKAEGWPFQKRVLAWMMECFSMEICRDGMERNHRFLEEALELVQSLGCTQSEAHQLVDYTFTRPVGDPTQELGGVMVTIAALCFPNDLDMNEAAETELARVWEKIDIIRAKQAAKPKHSPLPAKIRRPGDPGYRSGGDAEAKARDAGVGGKREERS